MQTSAFKDPVGKIWELADPVVSPAYTAGLEGTPNEVKLKYLADNDFADLKGDELKEAIKGYIHEKDEKAQSLKGTMVGTPNEVKLKYLADNDFADLKGDELKEAIKGYIHEKDEKAQSLKGTMVTQGTTPRRLTDLIGSLADLTSGSGDKGTPIIYIQGYFDNYTK